MHLLLNPLLILYPWEQEEKLTWLRCTLPEKMTEVLERNRQRLANYANEKAKFRD